MMIKNSMSLKAKINNTAKNENISPQAIMQTYILNNKWLKSKLTSFFIFYRRILCLILKLKNYIN